MESKVLKITIPMVRGLPWGAGGVGCPIGELVRIYYCEHLDVKVRNHQHSEYTIIWVSRFGGSIVSAWTRITI